MKPSHIDSSRAPLQHSQERLTDSYGTCELGLGADAGHAGELEPRKLSSMATCPNDVPSATASLQVEWSKLGKLLFAVLVAIVTITAPLGFTAEEGAAQR